MILANILYIVFLFTPTLRAWLAVEVAEEMVCKGSQPPTLHPLKESSTFVAF